MRKRKPPVLWITVLVLMVGVVSVYNLMQSGVITFNRPQPQQAPPEAQVSPANEKEEMRSKMQERMQVSKTPPPGPDGPAAGKGRSVELPKRVPYKPVPNESATSAQWYTPESRTSTR